LFAAVGAANQSTFNEKKGLPDAGPFFWLPVGPEPARRAFGDAEHLIASADADVIDGDDQRAVPLANPVRRKAELRIAQALEARLVAVDRKSCALWARQKTTGTSLIRYPGVRWKPAFTKITGCWAARFARRAWS
jgi:hypothetical protein